MGSRFKPSTDLFDAFNRIKIVLKIIKDEHGISKDQINKTEQKFSYTLKDLNMFIERLDDIAIAFGNLNDQAFNLAMNQVKKIPCLVKVDQDE